MVSEAELAQLAAKAAQAKAEAAQAAADAAQAAYEAVLAAARDSAEVGAESVLTEPSAAAETSSVTELMSRVIDPTSNTVIASEVNSETTQDTALQPMQSSSLSDYAQRVQTGYTREGAIPLGVYLEEGEPVASVPVTLPLATMNRHGLIAGATGTGKTRTLQLLAEGLSDAGVPVFLTDIKGDLTGLVESGVSSPALEERTVKQGQAWVPAAFPAEFYSLGGQGEGLPIRTSVTDFGPLLLAKVLGLNDTQESALSLIFHWADQAGLALIDLGDLRSALTYLTSDEGKDELTAIGGVAPATAGVILREISALEAQGANEFFGEPAFDVHDFMRLSSAGCHAGGFSGDGGATSDGGGAGRGVLSILELPDLSGQPALFSSFIIDRKSVV